MAFVETIKERVCESNKKVSFSQKSSIETKSAIAGEVFDSMGQTFSIYAGEVIESALFERVTRDCRGTVLRTSSVRRFRQIGEDEWFSVLAAIGNDSWDSNFTSASDKEAIRQGEKNIGLDSEKFANPIDTQTTKANVLVVSEQSFLTKNKRNITIAILAVAAIGFYKYYGKKK